MAGRPPARAVQGAASGMPRPLDGADHGVPRGGRVLVRHRRPTTSTRSATTGRRTRPSCGGITALTDAIMPLELTRAMFIGMDPPKHDRLKMLFQRGFTPRRIAEHEDAIRAITVGVLDGLAGRETCDLVTDVAQPVVSRVIGSFMGIPPADDEIWARLMNTTLGAGDPDLNPDGVESVMERDVPEIFERCRRLIAERRERPDRRPDQRPGPCRARRPAAGGTRDRDGVLPPRSPPATTARRPPIAAACGR